MKVESEWGLGNEAPGRTQGNPEALAVLSSRYRRLLYFIAYRVLRNHREGEDAVQNGLLTASYSVPKF
jgi:DNA-directed RNA polymerase specialized sigma24 family protein